MPGSVGPGERDRQTVRREPGTSSVTVPSGWVTVRLVAPAGMTSWTGVPGLDRLGRGGGAAQQLAGQVGEQDREGDLERQVGLARLEGQDGRRQAGPGPGVQQRRALGPGDDGPRPVGQGQLRRASAMWVVDRST